MTWMLDATAQSARLAAGETTPLELLEQSPAGGSTRMPTAYTGLVGMRPSNGRVARGFGFPPMVMDFQAIGPFACVFQ